MSSTSTTDNTFSIGPSPQARSSRDLTRGPRRSILCRPRAVTLAALFVLACGWTELLVATPAPAGPAEAVENERGSGEPSPVLRAAGAFAQGKLLEDQGNLEDALEAYELALELDGSDPYAFLEAAKLHAYLAQVVQSERRDGHLESASRYAAEARRLAPDNLDILSHFAQLHLRLVEQNEFDSLAIATQAYETLRAESETPDLQVLTSLGQLYLWQRRDQDAAEVLRQASALRPGFTMLQRMLLEALLGAGETQEAETVLTELVELDPDNLEHRGRLAELLSQRGDHRGAVEILESSSSEILEDARMRRVLARELHLAGKNEEALAIADTLLLEPEGRDRLRRLRVAIFSSLARYDDAADELRPLLGTGDDPEQTVNDGLLMARLMERIGRDGEAASLLQGLQGQTDPANARQAHQIVMARVGFYERQGLVDEALALLEQQIAEDGEDGGAAVAFGRVKVGLLSRLGRTDEALAALEVARQRLAAKDPQHEALAIQHLALLEEAESWDMLSRFAEGLNDSTSPELRDAAMLARAEALAASDDLDGALALLREAEEAAQENGRRFLAIRLDLLLRHGRVDAARPELDKLAKGGSNEAFFAAQMYQQHELYDDSIPILLELVEEVEDPRRPLFLLAAAHERSGDRGAAVEAFERLLEADPDYIPALNYLGYMWAEKGENLERAHDLIRRALANDPDNGAYVDSMGWVLFQLGRKEEARRHLEWAARLVSDDPTIFEHLGDVYAVLGQTEAARKAYGQALELGADHPDALRRKLDELPQEGP